jgi:hypothetical protein
MDRVKIPDMTKLIVAFRNFANAPESGLARSLMNELGGWTPPRREPPESVSVPSQNEDRHCRS